MALCHLATVIGFQYLHHRHLNLNSMVLGVDHSTRINATTALVEVLRFLKAATILWLVLTSNPRSLVATLRKMMLLYPHSHEATAHSLAKGATKTPTTTTSSHVNTMTIPSGSAGPRSTPSTGERARCSKFRALPKLY
jgi:DNA-binding MurR/RpiR family transcriptional regulator